MLSVVMVSLKPTIHTGDLQITQLQHKNNTTCALSFRIGATLVGKQADVMIIRKEPGYYGWNVIIIRREPGYFGWDVMIIRRESPFLYHMQKIKGDKVT